jgi:hypothetical protein
MMCPQSYYSLCVCVCVCVCVHAHVCMHVGTYVMYVVYVLYVCKDVCIIYIYKMKNASETMGN